MGRYIRRAIVLLPLIGTGACTAFEEEPAVADLIVMGGSVWTGEPGAPLAEAVAVAGGRIVEVGTAGRVDRLRGPDTRVVDAAGASVLPGLIDSHTHFLTGGFQLASVDLRDADTPQEFVRRIAAFAGTRPPGTWILGGSWDHERWGGELPHRSWIDSITPDHPVFVTRLDLHMGLANSRALELADVSPEEPSPPGGEIVREEGSGRWTGILKDDAMQFVQRAVPDPTPDEWDRALAAAASHALSLGITQVHDVDGWQSLAVYERALVRDQLPLRVYAVVPMSSWERLRDRVEERGRGDERLWWGGLKGFVDGSLGSTTAWFHEPYADAPGTSGLMTTDTSALRRWILDADAAGLQAVVHAIGDRANDWLLDAYEEMISRNGPRDRRPRIEHAQHLTRDAIGRVAGLGVVASMQPYHAADDGRWAEKRIGPERIRTTYAFRSLLDAGARLAFGSDWTVAPLDPFLGIDAAVTRRTLDGANPGGWVPEERITLEEALGAYTADASRAGFSERFSGTLSPGKAADLVVLDTDLFQLPTTELGSVRVERTFVGGVEVYRREAR
ncbi:MAG TPA: amidohydrolase family protein [Longimicrobiales bacterium]|nr:amidohydrolase family protein [Longimicrobiales bacterium]